MIKNMVENVVNQNQADTIVEFASAFLMCRPIDLDARIKYIVVNSLCSMGAQKKSAQIIFLQHFWVVLVLLVL